MAQSSLIKKLRVQPGQRLLILNAPPAYSDLLGPLPEDTHLSEEPDGKYDFVHIFVINSAELAALRPKAMDCVEYDGLLWISYPKRSSKVETDLSRDILWKLMDGTGLRPVTQISIDSVWSALRFRPGERVGR